ncbi:MAG: hypothetical protein JSV80_10085 [Acidobacteriota bacterium]|nr:MAG: hypothetical protein JSV80_10085 [Acidobacteriota bacterium]
MVDAKIIDALAARLETQPSLNARLLLLDPNSPFAEARARQLGTIPDEFVRTMTAGIEMTRQQLRRFANQCRIAVFDEPPTEISIIVDDVVFHSVFTAHQPSRHNPVIALPLHAHKARESFFKHMNLVWERSRPLDGKATGFFLKDTPGA